jgi:hypothetical protein
LEWTKLIGVAAVAEQSLDQLCIAGLDGKKKDGSTFDRDIVDVDSSFSQHGADKGFVAPSCGLADCYFPFFEG